MFLFGFLFICRNGLWCASDMQWLGLGVWGFSVDDDCVVLYSQRNKADLIKCSTNGKTQYSPFSNKKIDCSLFVSWAGFASLSLSHTLLYTHPHTHTCIKTDAYTYSLPHLFVITISARAALRWHLFSLSSNHSLYFTAAVLAVLCLII